MGIRIKKRKVVSREWKPTGNVDSVGRGLWKKGDLQCIVTLRRLSITHKSRCPTESDMRDCLDAFWAHWKGLAKGASIVEVGQTVHGVPLRVMHFFRIDLFEDPDREITAELAGLGCRMAWTADGAVPLADNQAHLQVAGH